MVEYNIVIVIVIIVIVIVIVIYIQQESTNQITVSTEVIR